MEYIICTVNKSTAQQSTPHLHYVRSAKGDASVVLCKSFNVAKNCAQNVFCFVKQLFVWSWLVEKYLDVLKKKPDTKGKICVGRESNPGQLLGRQLCSPLYHRRDCEIHVGKLKRDSGHILITTSTELFYLIIARQARFPYVKSCSNDIQTFLSFGKMQYHIDIIQGEQRLHFLLCASNIVPISCSVDCVIKINSRRGDFWFFCEQNEVLLD